MGHGYSGVYLRTGVYFYSTNESPRRLFETGIYLKEAFEHIRYINHLWSSYIDSLGARLKFILISAAGGVTLYLSDIIAGQWPWLVFLLEQLLVVVVSHHEPISTLPEVQHQQTQGWSLGAHRRRCQRGEGVLTRWCR